MEADKILEIGLQLVSTVIVPEFNFEQVDANIVQDDFKDFQTSLEINLPILFDVLHKNESLFLLGLNRDNLEFRTKLMLLLCEQTCTNKFFHVNSETLRNNISYLIQHFVPKYLVNNDDFVSEMFEIYKTKLKSETWKRNYSYIYSFGRFCELLAHTKKSIITNKCMIILAIGTNLQESYEPELKLISINLFDILLKYTDQSTIKTLNIHGVIFFTALPNLDKIKEASIISCLLDCLYNCVVLFDVTNYTRWNNIDDLLSAIFRKLSYESSSEISIVLLEFLNRLLSIKFPVNDTTMEYSEIRELSKKNCSYANYRWVKNLLALYISECQKHLGCGNNVQLLRLIHISYILGIYAVPPELIYQQNQDFYRNIVKLLMIILNQNAGQVDISHEIRMFIESFVQHFDGMENTLGTDATSLKDDLNVLLHHDVFKVK